MKKIPNLVAIINKHINDEEKAQDIKFDITQAGFINKLELSNYGYVKISDVSTAINSAKKVGGMAYVEDLINAIIAHKYSEEKK